MKCRTHTGANHCFSWHVFQNKIWGRQKGLRSLPSIHHWYQLYLSKSFIASPSLLRLSLFALSFWITVCELLSKSQFNHVLTLKSAFIIHNCGQLDDWDVIGVHVKVKTLQVRWQPFRGKIQFKTIICISLCKGLLLCLERATWKMHPNSDFELLTQMPFVFWKG